MDELEVSTVVYLPPEEIYEFLVDFPRYARYSKYLKRVRQDGDGGPGTEYALRFEWWKVHVTVHSQVRSVDPPNGLSFELTRGVRANGEWVVERAPDRVREDGDDACRVALVVRYDPKTVTSDYVNLPSFVSLNWVVDRVTPLIEEEARRVVERIVADIEGRRRPVELTVERH